jgi:hypothetical protein
MRNLILISTKCKYPTNLQIRVNITCMEMSNEKIQGKSSINFPCSEKTVLHKIKNFESMSFVSESKRLVTTDSGLHALTVPPPPPTAATTYILVCPRIHG